MTCSAIILAGGQGTRMNGFDKGLMLWQNQALIQHVITRLAPQVDDIIISCNRNIEQYQTFGYLCVTDEFNDFLGPLAGIASCIGKLKHNTTLICPCDTPLLPKNLYQQLSQQLSKKNINAAVAKDNLNKHYSHALINTSFGMTAAKQLNAKRKSLRAWYDTTTWGYADFGEQSKAFTNINELAQLSAS